MAMTKSTQGLLVLLVVAAIAGGGWYGWQFYSSSKAAVASSKASAVTETKSMSHAILTPPQDQLINAVLHATGLQRQIAQLPDQVRGGFSAAPNSDKMPPEIAHAIGKIISDSFAEEDINAQLLAQLKEKFDQQRMQALINDFSSPLVKRMVAMEVHMGSQQDQAAFFTALAAKPLSPARISTLQELDRAANGSEMSVEIAMSSIRAMAEAMAGNDPAQHAQVERELEKQRGPMMENMRNAILGSMAYTYRDASDADLAAYAKVYETDHAKWFSHIVMSTLKHGLENASKSTGERFAAFMKSHGAAQAAADVAPQTAAASGGTPAPEAKPVTTPHAALPARPKKRKPDGDIQKCLTLDDDRAIAKCTEAYR